MKNLLSKLTGLIDLMVRECSWGGKILGLRRGHGTRGVTSGICAKCATELYAKTIKGGL